MVGFDAGGGVVPRQRIATNISKAYWYNPKSGHTNPEDGIEPARIPRFVTSRPGSASGDEISWLDCLLDGGIVLPFLPQGDRHALTILLTGPPGAGKSILAAELCYRWATHEPHWNSLYLTSEAHEPWLIEKVESFRWPSVESVFRPEAGGIGVSVISTNDFNPVVATETLASTIATSLEGLFEVQGQQVPNLFGNLKLHTSSPEILVIDSLNTIDDPALRASKFRKLREVAKSGPRIILVVLDSAPSKDASEFWEFASDIVFRLDRRYEEYMVRTIEIIKARYQKHIWGVHQVKPYEPADFSRVADESVEDQRSRVSRAHPFRREGGIFVFPSIHYVLSAYKRSPLVEEGHIKSGVPGVPSILPEGYPRSRCTALLGERGGHKSHLGYLELLHRILHDDNESSGGLVVSLRDDEGMTEKTMASVLLQQWPEQCLDNGQPTKEAAKNKLRELQREDKLEILYYPPGYITPEEFFHRLMLSIHRLHATPSSDVTLLFNSLDQLSSRFPLCAKESIFIPGIIQMLSAEGISSFFVAAKEPDQPGYHGLDSLAELILMFGRTAVPGDRYASLVSSYVKSHFKKRKRGRRQPRAGERADPIDSSRQGVAEQVRHCVLMRVDRYAGGQSAGAQGILELIDEEDRLFELYGRPGLHFFDYQPSDTP